MFGDKEMEGGRVPIVINSLAYIILAESQTLLGLQHYVCACVLGMSVTV